VPFDVSHFFPNRPIGRFSRSSVALFALRSRPAHRALNRHRGLAWTAHDHFSGSRLASSSILAPWAALSSACKPTSRERLSRRLIWRATGKFGCHSGPGRTFRAELRNTGQALISQACVPGFRSVAALRPQNDGDLGLLQRTALAAPAAPAMREAATAGVSEACAMPVAAAEITGETAGHAMSEAVAEIAVRARIVRSVASVIG